MPLLVALLLAPIAAHAYSYTVVRNDPDSPNLVVATRAFAALAPGVPSGLHLGAEWDPIGPISLRATWARALNAGQPTTRTEAALFLRWRERRNAELTVDFGLALLTRTAIHDHARGFLVPMSAVRSLGLDGGLLREEGRGLTIDRVFAGVRLRSQQHAVLDVVGEGERSNAGRVSGYAHVLFALDPPDRAASLGRWGVRGGLEYLVGLTPGLSLAVECTYGPAFFGQALTASLAVGGAFGIDAAPPITPLD